MSNAIYRGTTPDIRCNASFDLTGYSVYVAIGPKPLKSWVLVNPDDITVERNGNVTRIMFRLTQEQTLACKAGKAFLQIRAVKDGNAIASDMVSIEIADVIEGGVING